MSFDAMAQFAPRKRCSLFNVSMHAEQTRRPMRAPRVASTAVPSLSSSIPTQQQLMQAAARKRSSARAHRLRSEQLGSRPFGTPLPWICSTRITATVLTTDIITRTTVLTTDIITRTTVLTTDIITRTTVRTTHIITRTTRQPSKAMATPTMPNTDRRPCRRNLPPPVRSLWPHRTAAHSCAVLTTDRAPRGQCDRCDGRALLAQRNHCQLAQLGVLAPACHWPQRARGSRRRLAERNLGIAPACH